jgi:amidohydrolase
MNEKLSEYIDQRTKELHYKVIQYREHLHAHPELSFQEKETCTFVSQCLTDIGITHEKGIGGTGIVGLILGDHHSHEDAFIGLRADLDALPIIEENDVPYKSLNNGIMHACGHDVHTSILLGAAEILFEIRNQLPHPIKLIFQPGESNIKKLVTEINLFTAQNILAIPFYSKLDNEGHVDPEEEEL